MSNTRRHPNVVNIEEVAAREEARGGFGYSTRRLGTEAAGKALGCGWYELPPGKTTFPFHYHSNLEEALYILEGAGALRIGDATVEVRAGDYAAFPVGPEHSHQLTNTGTTPLRYLCFSGIAIAPTLDVVGYPDSNKVAFVAGLDPANRTRPPTLRKLIKQDAPMSNYYDDEPLASK
jgi:uncharacterized cupin superfamily protein